jgi:hypothetical protein
VIAAVRQTATKKNKLVSDGEWMEFLRESSTREVCGRMDYSGRHPLTKAWVGATGVRRASNER